ncbi:MAG: hypothetical protein ACI39R_02390 [Lachnospiraceae bacterium]
MKRKRLTTLLIMFMFILTIFGIALAGTLHSASDSYDSTASAYVYGYVSITENALIRPATYNAHKGGSNHEALPCYLYVWTGKDVDVIKVDHVHMSGTTNYSKTFNTTNKYIGMKVHSTESGGTNYINIYASYK